MKLARITRNIRHGGTGSGSDAPMRRHLAGQPPGLRGYLRGAHHPATVTITGCQVIMTADADSGHRPVLAQLGLRTHSADQRPHPGAPEGEPCHG
jgi:hypothetical protein